MRPRFSDYVHKEKIQIRRIHDVRDNIYDIYDYMKENNSGQFVSCGTPYDTLEDVLKWHPNIEIEDKRRNEMEIKSKDIKIRIIERVIKHCAEVVTIEPLVEFNPPLVKKFDSGHIETVPSMRICIKYDIENNDKITNFTTVGTSLNNIINVDTKELEECLKTMLKEELQAYKHMLTLNDKK